MTLSLAIQQLLLVDELADRIRHGEPGMGPILSLILHGPIATPELRVRVQHLLQLADRSGPAESGPTNSSNIH